MRALFLIVTFLYVTGIPFDAFSHAGHLGELAGHSHWIALAAGGAAVSIAAALAVLGKKKDRETDPESEDDTDHVVEETSGS